MSSLVRPMGGNVRDSKSRTRANGAMVDGETIHYASQRQDPCKRRNGAAAGSKCTQPRASNPAIARNGSLGGRSLCLNVGL